MNADKILGLFKNVLVLCPHTDDEFGCAGSLVRLASLGTRIRYVAFSRCEKSVPAGYAKDALEKECRNCLQKIGLKNEDVSVLGYEVREFPKYRQEILEDMVKMARDYNPDLVLLPSSYDTHQDHNTIFMEGFRAFKKTSLLGYELPQNTIQFENSAFISLSKEQIEKKIEVMGAYESQKFRPYASSEFIKGLALVRGAQVGTQYAEAFEVIRLVL